MHGTQSKAPQAGSTDMQAAMEEQNRKLEKALSRIQHKLIVMSGKGGVGKSSISANLAVYLAGRGFKTGLIDVDLHGPSIAQMMGLEGLLDITSDGSTILPRISHNDLKVVSMQSLMQDRDQAVIWRGPAKTGIIRQFIANVQWEDLDFLVIDAPPGTGDEPLTVAQTIADAKAVIVTTPQDVALSDVRKSISFCKTIQMHVVGLIENMGPFDCPCCGKTISLFKQDGGRQTAQKMNIPFLGTLPFDPDVVRNCDAGTPIMAAQKDSAFSRALSGIVTDLTKQL